MDLLPYRLPDMSDPPDLPDPHEPSRACDVVKLKWINRQNHERHALWIRTGLIDGTIFWCEGDLKHGMYRKSRDEFNLLWPSPQYVTDFQGIIRWAKYPEAKRVCDEMPVPGRQLDESGFKLKESIPLFGEEEWIIRILAKMRADGLIEPALSPFALLEMNSNLGNINWQ